MPSKKKKAKDLEETKVTMTLKDFVSVFQCIDALAATLAQSTDAHNGNKVDGGKKAMIRDSKTLIKLTADLLNSLTEELEKQITGGCGECDGKCCEK